MLALCTGCAYQIWNGTHYVYDSLCKPKTMLDIEKQVASYSYHDKSTVRLVTRTVQQQKNGVDCGLFSIAFATTLASGGDAPTVMMPHY